MNWKFSILMLAALSTLLAGISYADVSPSTVASPQWSTCTATSTLGSSTTCYDYCQARGQSCYNYGCQYPTDPNSYFGALYYGNGVCSGVSTYHYQCFDKVNTDAGVKCCCGSSGLNPTPSPQPTPAPTPVPANQAPSISGVSGPTSLNAGDSGTWTVSASDPEGGSLSYSVIWGDESTGRYMYAASPSYSQTATFTHTYSSSGSYSPTFTVKDNRGATAQTSISVNVLSTAPSCSGYTALNLGQKVSSNGYSIKLLDVTASQDGGKTFPAYLEIQNSSGTTFGQITVNEYDKYTWTNSQNQDTLFVYVCQTAPGFTINAKFAYVKLVVVPAPMPILSAASCSETDAGAKYDSKGTSTWYNSSGSIIGTYTDSCNGNYLTEYYCNANYKTQNSESVGLSTQYYCANGCSNGACNAPPLSPRTCSSNTTISEAATGTSDYASLGTDISAHPEILQYRVQFSDGWSRWYVPGQGDLDWKTNTDGTQRRIWSYFQDHQHEIIKCTDTVTPDNSCSGYPRIYLMQSIGGGPYSLRLTGFENKASGTNLYPAKFDILDTSGSTIGQISMQPNTNTAWTVPSNGDVLHFYLCQTSNGNTPTTQWANVRLVPPSTIGVPGPVASCSESDGGWNTDVKSTNTWRDAQGNTLGAYTDSCNGNILTEFYCNANYHTQSVDVTGLSQQYTCVNGCSDGACQGSSVPTSCPGYTQLGIGQNITSSGYTVMFASGSNLGPYADSHYAGTFFIYDSTGAKVGEIALQKNSNTVWTNSANGDTVSVSVCQLSTPFVMSAWTAYVKMSVTYGNSQGLPDLEARGGISGYDGKPDRALIRTINIGSGYASASKTYYKIWDSDGVVIDEKILDVPALSPNEANDAIVLVNCSVRQGKSVYLSETVDYAGQVQESNENNNAFGGPNGQGGIVQYTCPSSSSTYGVSLGVSADQASVHLNDNVKITSKITYSGSASDNSAQQFKVVTDYYAANAGYAGANGRVYLLDGADSSVISAATSSASAIEERTDYVTLSPGQSTTVTSYFAATSAGAKQASVKVYQKVGSNYNFITSQSVKITVYGTPSVATSLHLYPGWNMVSVPNAGGSVSMSDAVSLCDASPNAWQLASSGYVKATTLTPGNGYWVHVGKECSVPVQGSTSGGTITLAPLFAGWNLVGAPQSSASISDYMGTCQINGGPWYYAVSGSSTHSYVSSSVLSPGNAYWINVKSACSLGYSDEQPPSPPS